MTNAVSAYLDLLASGDPIVVAIAILGLLCPLASIVLFLVQVHQWRVEDRAAEVRAAAYAASSQATYAAMERERKARLTARQAAFDEKALPRG